MTISKRDALAACCRYSGITRALGLLPDKPLLLVLNYHRIGNGDESPYGPDNFSCTEEQFDGHVRFLKRRMHVASLDEAIDLVEKRSLPRRPMALLTFDDGYVDNYQIAFPVLKSHGVQGLFFLPTAFIGSDRISWWDSVAYIVKHSRKRKFRLGIPPYREIDLDAKGPISPTLQIMYLYKSEGLETSEPFLARLEEACGSARPDGSERSFMNWEEAAAMLRGGMAIGSHGHSHQILARLAEEEQLAELVTSKRILEERLGAPVRALSYPVGHRNTFSAATRAAAAEAQYRVAFSFYEGFNRFGAIDPFDIRRLWVTAAVARFSLQITLGAASGSCWF